jgi:hypothetical protein
MVLPKPSQIIVGDLEPSSNFHPNAGKIGDYIKSEATNRELGSITCFQYQARDNKPYYYGYFALHHPLTRHTVNAALRAARKACGKGFDLQMHDIPPTVSSGSIPNCPNFAQLKTLFDRRDASVTSNLHVDVASCPQFGIHG